jgi:quercetin dioxygenase-like cupin family protein
VKCSLLALVTMAVLLSSGCETQVVEPITIAEDITVEAPQQAEKLVDNEWVAAARITLKPREALPLHKGLDRVVYSLSRYRLRFELQDQTPEVKDFDEGDIHWHGQDVHAVSNSGTLTAGYLTLSRKQPAPTPEKESGLLLAARGYSFSVLNNNDVRVVQVDLAGKGRVKKHFGNGQIVSVMTAAKMKFTAGTETVEKEFQVGDSFWQPAGDRTVQNLSGDAVRYIVTEFKE